jgi:hypothetical protein
MNLVLNNKEHQNNFEHQIIDETQVIQPARRNFIEANTQKVELNHLKNDCIIPVFAKDMESTISHYEFIESTKEVVEDILGFKGILTPDIRVSHVIKGRISSSLNKPVKELKEDEKTVYYERMMFTVEIPEISEIINGNRLNLTIGGVRNFSEQNLYGKKSIEKFKVFIGFQNTVCTNLCISTDGLKDDLRISSVLELKSKIYELINGYAKKAHLESLERMSQFSLTELQFAHLIGKMKLFPYLSKEEKNNLFPLALNDSQINTIVKDYHNDLHFCKSEDGNINFWNLYNLFTEANKSTYIDSNLDRNVSAYAFIDYLANIIQNRKSNWFLI